MRSLFAFAFALCALLSAPACAASYKTPQFNDGTDRIATMFICAVAGFQSHRSGDALGLVQKVIESQGGANVDTTPWLDDALTFWETEGKDLDRGVFWDEQCQAPFDRLARLFGPTN